MYSENTQDAQACALAASLDCLTEGELQLLAGVQITTLEAWRKRGVGPQYVRLGTRYLYPREQVRAFIAKRVHTRRSVPAKAML